MYIPYIHEYANSITSSFRWIFSSLWMYGGCSNGGAGCLMLASSHKANILHFNKRHQQQQYRSIEHPTLKIYFNISFNQ